MRIFPDSWNRSVKIRNFFLVENRFLLGRGVNDELRLICLNS